MKPLITYLLFAYGITWSILFTLIGLHNGGLITDTQLDILHSLGALGPILGAIFTVSLYYGTTGRNRLLQSLSLKKLNRQGLFLALSPLGFFVISLLIYPFWTGHWFSFQTTVQQFQLTDIFSYIGWSLPFIVYAIFEELGWRGFALPHLQEKYSAFTATCILAGVWALWHLPMFFFRFHFSIGIAIGFFFSIFVATIIFTSIFNTTKGSTLAAIIFHGANNFASLFDTDKIVVIVSIGFMITAAFLLWKYGRKNLSDSLRVKNYFISN